MDRMKSLLCLGLFFVFSHAAMSAPVLRLTLRSSLRQTNGSVQPVWIASGANGPTDLFFEAWNDGDGSLNLSVDGGSTPWLKPELSATQSCSFDAGLTCQQIRVLFESAGLADGTYEGTVEVRDPNAVDAPQRVPVTIHVGGNTPDRIDLYVPPIAQSVDAVEFQTAGGPAPTLLGSGGFLTISSSGQNPFNPDAVQPVHTHRVAGTYEAGLPLGDLEGNLTISGSTFGPDNGTFPVTLHVTNDPIVERTVRQLRFVTAQGVEVIHRGVRQFVVLSNRGNGTLAVTSATAETASGGDWLSVEDLGDGLFQVTASVGALEIGLYRGTLRFETNAANNPPPIEVTFDVEAPGGPESAFRGVVNGASFDGNAPLAPGAIVSLFGSQLALGEENATTIPLPTSMVSTEVLINSVEAPLFFVSYGQINFQVPWEVPEGMTTVSVMRDGIMGNEVQAAIAPSTPGIFVWPGLGTYGIVQNFTQGNCPLPRDIPCPTGQPSAPARAGDAIVIWAAGLGPVSPEVPTGTESPLEPLAQTQIQTRVLFGRQFTTPQVRPFFSGMTPGLVGLFQVNVTVPSVPTSPRTGISLQFTDGRLSNTVEIATER